MPLWGSNSTIAKIGIKKKVIPNIPNSCMAVKFDVEVFSSVFPFIWLMISHTKHINVVIKNEPQSNMPFNLMEKSRLMFYLRNFEAYRRGVRAASFCSHRMYIICLSSYGFHHLKNKQHYCKENKTYPQKPK